MKLEPDVSHLSLLCTVDQTSTALPPPHLYSRKRRSPPSSLTVSHNKKPSPPTLSFSNTQPPLRVWYFCVTAISKVRLLFLLQFNNLFSFYVSPLLYDEGNRSLMNAIL
ncbi:hypothetical protein RHMOL_Rhmol01G0154600 [Rhododendron molle]|uniref:Uncharacterized protein n=1 Tax=Rhododendron molle TaxID=49168 RepID=A0ACC0Q546_RHOML|nr:hypothetical protein RHMOL_Rhmol01G0154600 [Rhododendron molle]